MGRIVIIVIVLLVAGLGASFFLLPNTATRTETIEVARPASTVFARLASTQPNTQIAEGVTIGQIRSAENNVVVADVAFADGAQGQVTYTVVPDGEGATVRMQLQRNLDGNPLSRLTAIGGGPVTPFAEAAAAAVTTDLNALPNAEFAGLAYQVVQIEAQPFFYVQRCVPNNPDSITDIIRDAVAGIPPIMRARGLQPTGPLMAVEPQVMPGQYCFQVGYPYRGRAPATTLFGETGQTPGGTMLHIHYTGTEADVMDQVYNRMDALLAAARLDANPADPSDDWVTYEVYNDDPLQEGGSRNRDIYYVTQGDISRLTALLPPSAPAAAPAATDAPATETPAPAPQPAPATP